MHLVTLSGVRARARGRIHVDETLVRNAFAFQIARDAPGVGGAERVADRPMRLRGPATGWLGLLSAVAQTATPIIRAGRIAGIPIRFWDFIACNRDQKLFAHFGEAGTAIFAVKQVEYGGHDRTLA
jgi:hypothetical protein